MSAAELLVLRHAEAGRATDQDRDPGLSPRGLDQALSAADAVAERLAAMACGPAPVRVLTSPLRRAWQTAAAIAAQIGRPVEPAPAFAEIPWRGVQPVIDRSADIADWMTRSWPDLPPPQRTWRDGVLSAARSIDGTAVVVTHFVPLNVLLGAALGSDRVLVFRPANASLTGFGRTGGELHLRSLGDEQPDMFAGPATAPGPR